MATSSILHARTESPFNNITHHKLKNGLDVILAPDAKSEFLQIKVNVGVGHIHEDEKNTGISHLLEHVIFRNSKLKEDMSYLQIIKEKDGTANGTTSLDQTSYFATVKKANGNWIINLFHDMIMRPTLDPKHVKTEKKTVLLEIGEPSAFDKALGFDLSKTFAFKYLNQPNFWEKYFGVKVDEKNSRTETRLSTLKLNADQIRTHYKKYYDPSNMQIIISGNFDSKEVLSLVKKLWSSYPTKNIGDQRPKYSPTQPKYAFQDDDVSSRPRIQLGYLVSKYSYREKEVMLSYTEYLSHRLMKKLRNLHGETYTVHDDSRFKQNFGVFAISMQTSKEKFDANHKIVKDIIRQEVEAGKINDTDIQEAKRLYLNNFLVWSQNASGHARMSERMFSMKELSGTWETPHEILEKVSPDEYRQILKKFGVPGHRYEDLGHPELLFSNDYLVFSGIFAICIFFFFKFILLKPFKNDHVRWVRKVRFPPLKFVEIGVGGCILIVCFHSLFLVYHLTELPLFSKLGILGFYLQIPIWIMTLIASAQAVISYFPRKLYVMDDYIVVKSLSYFSIRIHKSTIKSIHAVSVFKIIFSPGMWLPLWNSFHFYDPKFWKKGLLIKLRSGKLYFYSTKDSELCVQELRGLLGAKEEIQVEQKEAA